MLADANNKSMFEPPKDISEDATRRFIRDIDRAINENSNEIVLDCSHLQQVTSSHINALWQAWRLCHETGRKVRLHRPPAGLIRVLRALDLHDLFLAPDGNLQDSRQGPCSIGDEAKEYHFQDSFAAKAGQIDKAQDRFSNYLESLGVDEMTIFELTTVFYEVTTNIRTHGRLSRHDSIEFNALYSNGEILMEFIDPGQPFDMRIVPYEFDPDDVITDRKTHGFGLIMINRLTDSLEYKRKQNRFNVLTLTKKWR
jgi:anti-sigma regulatory factor (Ser/Thr protein kinase)/ABC-type transporter Mla MlaB component